MKLPSNEANVAQMSQLLIWTPSLLNPESLEWNTCSTVHTPCFMCLPPRPIALPHFYFTPVVVKSTLFFILPPSHLSSTSAWIFSHWAPSLFLFLFFFCMRIQVVCVCMCSKESTRGRGHGAGLGVGGVKTDKLRWRIIGGGPLQWGVRPRRSTPFQTLYQTPHSLLWLSSSLSLLPLLLHLLFLLEI